MGRHDTPNALAVAPLPGFARAQGAALEALPSLEPLSRETVSAVAHRRMIEAGGQWVPYRADVAPYMAEPMDATLSRRFDSVAFVGPARSSKSEGLVMNPLAHAILARPRVVAVFSPTKDAAQEWSLGAVDPLVTHSPELRDRLARGKGGDNVFGKRFRGGCRLTIDWPVKSKLAQRSIALVIGTDYDAFPLDVGGDGEAFPLMRKRTESAGSRGMTVVESSPRHPILDETWTPKTAHEAPPCEGIVGIYNAGSRGRLYWTCDDCGEGFEPRFDRLRYPDEGSAAERGAAAYMECPHCGGVTEARRKAEMNAGARWLHECEGGALVPLPELTRAVATASYWLPGPAAALAPWSRIVSRYLEAEAAFARTRDERGLKAVTNTELGLPYLPRNADGVSALSASALREGASDHAWKVAPEGTAFVTVAVDVQVGYFAVQVEAWARDLERVVIDRFDIVAPPASSPRPEGRRIDPARVSEDWDALAELAGVAYPVEGSDHGLMPVAIIVDSNGEPGVTPNAYAFARAMRRAHPRRFHLVRGKGGDLAKRAEMRRPETSHRGKQFAARDLRIIHAATDRLKDEVAASLTREARGARKLHVPRFARAEVFEEFAAERKTPKGWRKRPGVQRNESFDLAVYALALAIILQAEAVDWDAPPPWARVGPDNLFARPMGAGDAPSDPPSPSSPPQPGGVDQEEATPRRGWAVKRAGGRRPRR